MSRLFCVLVLIVSGMACAQGVDHNQGNFEGVFTGGAMRGEPVRAEIIGERDGYRANIYIGKAETKLPHSVRGTVKRNKVVFSGDTGLAVIEGGPVGVEMTLTEGRIKGKFTGNEAPGAFAMARVEKKSPTLGATPPAGALILFDGSNLDAWQPAERPWNITPEGAVEVGKGALRTKQELGEGEYHVEFRTPYMPTKKGQARGNSGVYVLGRYEIQVLDSFGLETRDNECGGIYKLATPEVNACLPPLEWQTYDITVRAPRFDAQGNKIDNTVISVRHNGILIHDNVKLAAVTGGSVSDQEAATGILFLQDHGNKVQFRNIWFKPPIGGP